MVNIIKVCLVLFVIFLLTYNNYKYSLQRNYRKKKQ